MDSMTDEEFDDMIAELEAKAILLLVCCEIDSVWWFVFVWWFVLCLPCMCASVVHSCHVCECAYGALMSPCA